ncbi:MAG: ADP-heptose--LPS heptosyltransferase 2 [Candidatus Anoxychlamydiales bacterium]|nr:ADP-heptose--LPS heptosyltransferase 2 [Candidatus Anoxychlamydiales bacterium]
MEKVYKNIIVRMPNWIGDFVMALPVLEDLKKKYPNSKITIMLKESLKDLVENISYIDEIYTFKKPKNKIYPKNIIKDLKEKKYDLGILLTNSISSAIWFYFAKVKNKIGYRNYRSIFLNSPTRFSKNRFSQHQIITYKELLKPLSINISNTMPTLQAMETDKNKIVGLLNSYGYQKNKKLIGINAFAAYGSAKCYPIDKYILLAKKLIEDKNNFVIFIGDKKNVNKDLEVLKNENQIINLIGKTSLKDLIALISIVDVFISNDSGPMHIASAFNKNLIALFGSTSDIITSPYSKNKIVINKRVKCSPCFKRKCPIDFKCMNEIKIEEIFKEINNFNVKKTI